MEYNSKLCIFIAILLVCDLTFALDGQCHSGYYDCVGHEWCCPYGYKCTGLNIACYSYTTYYSSGSPGSGSLNIGKIIGGCISVISFLLFLMTCILRCCCCTSGEVEESNTQSGGQDKITVTEIQQQTASESRLENGNVSHIQIPIQGEYPGYPPPSNQH